MSRGWHGPHTHLRGPRPTTVARMEQIKAMRAEGRTFAAIAAEFGISKQRVHAIVTREPNETAYHYRHAHRSDPA